MRSACLLAAALLAAAAEAQSTIYGVDLRNDRVFTTDTGDFVGNFTAVGSNAAPLYAVDFDAAAAQLWAVRNDTLEYGTIDLVTGVFSSIGVLSGPTLGVTGLTCAPDGTWYLSEYDGSTYTSLYAGDVAAGTFTLVGPIAPQVIIDIAADSSGNLYGHSISSDALFSIDAATGAGTLIGPTGQAANFAQGMDFDWSDDTLYATIYTGGGTGVFAALDLTTGMANVLQSTTVLDAEMEMAVRAGGFAGTPYCFGDGTGTPCPCGNAGGPGNGCANGTNGRGAHLGSAGSLNGIVLDIAGGTPSQFVLFFEGTNAVNGGMGVLFGDGLRCAGSNVIRLDVVQMDASGAATMPGTVQSNGGGGAPGATRYYQGWYRDPQFSPCGAGFNLTNGVRVDY